MAQNYNDVTQKKLSKVEIGGQVRYLKDAAVRAILDTYGNVVTHNMASSISDGTTGVIATAKQVKDYVDAQVGSINKFDVQVYDKLPTATKDTMFILALVADESAEAGSYVEYITIRSKTAEAADYTYAWEQIGSTKTDLSGYVKKTQKVAGIDLQDDITVTELSGSTALNLKALSHKDNASGTVSTVDSITMDAVTVEGNATVTTTTTAMTSSGNFTPKGSVTGTVVPTGTVATTVATTDTAATITRGDYTPEGAVSVTLGGATFNQITGVGTQASFTEGKFTPASITKTDNTFAKTGITATVSADDDELLVFSAAQTGTATQITAFSGGSKTADTFTANTLPTMKSNTVSVSTASFTGVKAESLKVTGVNYQKPSGATSTFTGNAKGDAVTATFSGTQGSVSVSGNYEKADATAAYSSSVTPTVKSITRTNKTVTVQ